MSLDLLVPGLLPPADAPAALREARLPAVERWLARADLQRVARRGADAWLGSVFALPDPPPVAAVALAADAGRRPGAWLRADPVHLRMAQDAARLHGPEGLAVTRAEADALVAALQAHFAADGLEFLAPHPARWYVRVPAGELPRTTPLEAAIGRDVAALLPRTAGGRIRWPAAITEAQMVLAAHPVNAAREAAGQPPLNSVWFWGGGELPAALSSPYGAVHAHGAFARGLGVLAGARVAAPPEALAALAPASGGGVLAVDERLARAIDAGDPEAWLRAARALDDGWFAHLGAAAARFACVRLVLPTAGDTLVAAITPRARWRWLRRARPLADHA